MPLPLSSLSRVCRYVADFVGSELEASTHSVRVLIGSPAEAAKDAETEHRINLFFYLIEPSGFGLGMAPGETWLLRLHCLVTAFGAAESPVSSGENDLRLLGEVLRAFHEKPVLPPLDIDGLTVRMQAVFEPLTLDQINHIWSTQGDVTYRPSIGYEMSLLPVVPKMPAVASPLVSAIEVGVHAVEEEP